VLTGIFGNDSRGLPTTVTDRTGDRTEHNYDTFGRRVETRHLLTPPGADAPAVPIRTVYAYNRDDQLTGQVDHLGRITRFEYDTAGRLRGTGLADQTSDEYAYDRIGNVTGYRDRNGIGRTLTWDALNRNTQVSIDPSDIPPGITPRGAMRTQFDYDALGRITLAANDFCTDGIEYDSLVMQSETISFTATSGVTTGSDYVLARETSDTGAVTALTYPSGRRLVFTRDVLDRVVEVAQSTRGVGYPGDPGTPDTLTLATVEYQGLRPRSIARGNGATTRYGYDFNGRAVDVAHRAGALQVLRQQVLYDAEGRVRQRSETGEGQPVVQRFDYDSLARLIAVGQAPPASMADLSSLAAPSTPVADAVPNRQPEIDALISAAATPVGDYSYDEVGNRLAAHTSSGAHTYQPNELDEYADVDGRPVTYDLNGNRTDDDGFSYGYDYRNQLVELRDQGNNSQTSFLRDAFGRICVQRTDTEARAVLYDGWQVIEEYGQTSLLRSVVSADRDDHYLLASSSGTEGYLLHDLTRSVRAVHDGAAVRSSYSYDEFGRLLAPPSPGDDNVFFYADMRLAGTSGCYHCDYRTYDPVQGRFLQRDPRGFVDDTNLYVYGRNNPLTLSDSQGTESRQEHPPIAAKLGAELAYRNPEGFTLAVPNNFDPAKIKTYRQRINDPVDRGIGIRSRQPGMKTATEDIRRANQQLRDDFEASLPGGRRPAGTDIDHTVELQHIIRSQPGQFAPGADTVRPQDHRVQDSSLNSSQGSRAQKVKARQVRNGAPLDTSAGGVSRERDVNKLWNREGYRTTNRYFGYYNLVGGTFDSLTSTGDQIRQGDFAGAGLNTSAYLGGAFEMGGIAARSSALLSAGRWLGAPAAVISSFVIGARIGTNLYENYVDKQMCLDAGSWVEEKTGSRILGALAAADAAVGDAIVHAPEAAYDYVKDNVTLDPDEIDWDRTLKPWKWL
jgi:RHS repeat-associated protein